MVKTPPVAHIVVLSFTFFVSLAACSSSGGAVDGTGGANGSASGSGGTPGAGGSGSGGNTGGTGSTSATGGSRSGTGGTASGTGGTVSGTGGTGNRGAGGSITVGAGGTTAQGGFTGTGSTVHGIFIPNAHPRLFWTPARLAAAQNWWKSHSFTPGSGATDQQIFAYVMTGNAKYCQSAITSAMAVDLSGCPASKAGCDPSRYDGELSVLTYDWCYAVMTDSQRSTFISHWNTWLSAISMQSWGGPGMSQSNYYWGNVRNEAEWGIASYFENQTVAEQMLTDALVTRYEKDFVPASIKPGQGLGGLGLEGGQYGPYQGYYIGAIVFPSIVAGGRDILDETPYWKGTVLNRIYMTPPQKTVSAGGARDGWDVFPFDDDETWQNGSPGTASEKGTFMTAAANQWAPSNIGKWARQWLAQVKPGVDAAAASTDVGGATQDFSGLPLDYYNGGTRYLVGRSDWTANATSYLWQMGQHYSDGHEHADWGAFQINRQGRWLSRETAGYTESVPGYGGTGSTPLASGIAHNVPLINGAAATGNSSPVVNRLESQAGYAYADADLSNAFGKSGTHVEREYFFIRDIETTVIFDRLTSAASASKTFIFHCETNPMLVDATHVLCVDGTQQLAVTTLLPAAPSSRTVVNESKGSNPPPPANVQYRVELNDMPNAATSYTLHVLQAMNAGGTPLAATVTDSAPSTPTSGTLTVKLDATHTLTLTKGMTSTGGSISIGGKTSTLRADVEPFALDGNDVPTWGP